MSSSGNKIDKAIGRMIKTARQQKGWSAIELADQLGLDNFKQVQEWESGSTSLPLHILYHVCTVLNVSEEVLQRTILENSTTEN